MFTVQVNVLGRARPLLYEEAVNPDSGVGSIVEMVTDDLSDEETRSFLDAYTFEGTTLFWMKSTPKVTLAIENRTPDMHAISRNDFVEELYLPHRAGVQELADIGVPLIFNLCIVPPPTGATDDLELIAITTQERFRQRTRNWFL